VINQWIKGHVDPWWKHEHRDLDYHNEPFNNPADLDRWRKMGYTHTKFTGDMYDMRNPAPKGFDIDRLQEHFNFEHLSWSFYKMTTGTVLPEHVDTFKRFKTLHDCEGKIIVRALVMLEDWKPGHYLDLAVLNMNPLSAGDYAICEEPVPHSASNIGIEDRYTLQITGLINERLIDWDSRR